MTTRFMFPDTIRISSNVKLVDLSEAPAAANIVRQGLTVPPVALDNEGLARFVQDGIVKPSSAPRVVSQSVKTGTKVPRGTVVDLFLAPRRSVPGSLIPAPHLGIATATASMEDIVDGPLGERLMRERVAKYASFEEMPQPERTAFHQGLVEQDVQIDDTDPDFSSDAAFRTMKAALAFS